MAYKAINSITRVNSTKQIDVSSSINSMSISSDSNIKCSIENKSNDDNVTGSTYNTTVQAENDDCVAMEDNAEFVSDVSPSINLQRDVTLMTLSDETGSYSFELAPGEILDTEQRLFDDFSGEVADFVPTTLDFATKAVAHVYQRLPAAEQVGRSRTPARLWKC
jgi:hypothetical protein